MRENRRKSKRVPMRVEVEMEWESGKRKCRITNLSMGGCFVESFEPIRRGEILSLMLPLTFGQWLQVSGELIHVYSNGFGIRFISLTDKEQLLLQEFIHRHGRNPSVKKVKTIDDAAKRQKTKVEEEEQQRQHAATNKESGKHEEFDQFIADLMGDIE